LSVCEVRGEVFPFAKQSNNTYDGMFEKKKKYDRRGGGEKKGGHRDDDEEFRK
jgi:hypothetical protein